MNVAYTFDPRVVLTAAVSVVINALIVWGCLAAALVH
jgi:hypothetical protein